MAIVAPWVGLETPRVAEACELTLDTETLGLGLDRLGPDVVGNLGGRKSETS